MMPAPVEWGIKPRLYVCPSVCPVSDPKSRAEGVASWKLTERDPMTRVTGDPI